MLSMTSQLYRVKCACRDIQWKILNITATCIFTWTHFKCNHHIICISS